MKIKRLVLKWIIIFSAMVISYNFNIDGILRFIIIFIGMGLGLFLVDYFLDKKS
jgi:uncharacterized membrane protein YgaE (UPF0421/DUF939 family)